MLIFDFDCKDEWYITIEEEKEIAEREQKLIEEADKADSITRRKSL